MENCKRYVPVPRVGKDFPIALVRVLTRTLRDNLMHDPTIMALEDVKSLEAYMSIVAQAKSPRSTDFASMPKAVMASYRLVTRILVKYCDPAPKKAAARKMVATRKFLASEEECAKTNLRFALATRFDGSQTDQVTDTIERARKDIASLLGEDVPYDHVYQYARFGPGVAHGIERRHVSTYYKYLRWPYSVPSRSIPHAYACITSDERWLGALEDCTRREAQVGFTQVLNRKTLSNLWLKPIDQNRVTFVPKNSESDRTIAIEPLLGVYLQLGVDGVLRRALRKWGVDLDDQTINQMLCAKASKMDLATLDLSAASDTVSLGVCKALLPLNWYNFLCDLRSPTGVMPDGSLVTYQKMSSMGNGFTFALESLIFAALVRGVLRRSRHPGRYAIYGDDIIAPNDIAPELIRTLEFCGFAVNSEKSFLRGPFHESCGVEYYDGTEIRPVYLREPVGALAELYSLYNRLRLWYNTHIGHAMIPFRSNPIGQFILDLIPTGWDLWGPACESVSSHLHADLDMIPQLGVCYDICGLVNHRQTTKPKDLLFGRLMARPQGTSDEVLSSGKGSVFDVSLTSDDEWRTQRLSVWADVRYYS